MLILLRNSVYGSACGLLLGGVLTLVVDSENRAEVVRWGVVIGTFSGFGYGIYELSTGEGYSEFTSRTWSDLPDAFASRTDSASETEPSASIETVPFPLKAVRAIGRSPVHLGTNVPGESRSPLRLPNLTPGHR